MVWLTHLPSKYTLAALSTVTLLNWLMAGPYDAIEWVSVDA
jgi:hypothetical protein